MKDEVCVRCELGEPVRLPDGRLGIIRASWVRDRTVPDRECSVEVAKHNALPETVRMLWSELRAAESSPSTQTEPHTCAACGDKVGCGLRTKVSTLEGRVTELQAEGTARVEASLARTVRAFHFRFGHPVAWTPAVPDAAQLRFRLALITEEFFELLEACVKLPGLAGFGTVRDVVARLVQEADVAVDFPAFADAMADLDYVIEGTRAVCGIDGGPIAVAVHAANMAKAPVLDTEGVPDPTQKPWKPLGWSPPDIAACLRRQGWVQR